MVYSFAAPTHSIIDRPSRQPQNYPEAPTTYHPSSKDEFGRYIDATSLGWKHGGDIIENTAPFDVPYAGQGASRSRAMHSNAASIISYGAFQKQRRQVPENARFQKMQGSRKCEAPEPHAKEAALSQGGSIERFLVMDESTMPGDLLIRKSSLPIRSRMAAVIRQRSIDMTDRITAFLRRSPFSRLPQRFTCIDVSTFRRALCYAFGEQWTALGMTTAEFHEVYARYIIRERTDGGDSLIAWQAFAKDITQAAGVRADNRGYMLEEQDYGVRASSALDHSLARDELMVIMDKEFSHDIETEEEAQQRVLKDIERVTGARSVAVTRYGSYEAKLHGRNQLGVIKQGDFERIGGHGDYQAEQGISADGSNLRTSNTQVDSQSHEYAADGQVIVGDGSVGYQSTKLRYNDKAAATATPYSACKRASTSIASIKSLSAAERASVTVTKPSLYEMQRMHSRNRQHPSKKPTRPGVSSVGDEHRQHHEASLHDGLYSA